MSLDLAPDRNAMVSIRNLHKQYGNLEVLKGIDLDIAPGEVVCVIGPSGSGKTTMLRCVNFLESYQDGRIYVDGQLVGTVGDCVAVRV